jgi:hypothetical protein
MGIDLFIVILADLYYYPDLIIPAELFRRIESNKQCASMAPGYETIIIKRVIINKIDFFSTPIQSKKFGGVGKSIGK